MFEDDTAVICTSEKREELDIFLDGEQEARRLPGAKVRGHSPAPCTAYCRLHSPLATSTALYFVLACSFASASSSLGGDACNRPVFSLQNSTCLSNAFSQNFLPQKLQAL